MLRNDLDASARFTSGDALSMVAHVTQDALRRIPPFVLAWWCFTAAVVASNVRQMFPDMPQPVWFFLAIVGSAGCGWAWMMSRALFRPQASIERWVFLVIAGIIAVEASWTLSGAFASGPWSGEIRRIAENAAALICISALCLVLIEPLSSYKDQSDPAERRFRRLFIGGYGALIAVSMLWAINADEGTFAGHWQDAVLTSCGVLAIMLSRIAVSYRKRHPAPHEKTQTRSKSISTEAMGDKALASRIVDLITDESVVTTPNLKIADMAQMLGEQEYKVTQCITGCLGYRNFNHMINASRIGHAKTAFAFDKNKDRPILSIAYDCGFNSIGPFNRAFKQETGFTPSEFRKRLEADAQSGAPSGIPAQR
ncbi:MAG: AraC family transcriptional regulator [Pseudomonadota bacterium]